MTTSDLHLTQVPVAKTGMLIRRPVADVYEAFVNPDITTQFWFSTSSGRLDSGTPVQWHWEWYGVSASVTVLAIEPPKRIFIEWPGQNGQTTVEWLFEPVDGGSTYVHITSAGFAGTGDEVAGEAIDSMGGFSLILAGCKAFLEHGINLKLVPDRHPPGIED